MSFKAYVVIYGNEGKISKMVRTLRKKPGVVSVDLLEDSPQLIMVVEAPERKKLAKLTIDAISSAEKVPTVMQLLTATSGKY